MKKILSVLLAVLLLLTTLGLAAAEETPANDEDHLVVAVTTPLTGSFSTSLWGNGSSDMDVRALLHGYNLIVWDTGAGMFVPDSTVVSGLVVTEDGTGARTYDIALCNDLVYSDGTPITAWDYAFSMLLTMSNEAKAIGGNVLRPAHLAGYEAYISGSAKALSGVRVKGDYMFSVTVKAEYLPFFYELGLLDCVPYPISVIAPGVRVADDGKGVYLTNANGGGATLFTAELLRQTLLGENGYVSHPGVTSGAYTLVSYENGVAEFDVNPRFKGDKFGHKPSIKHLTLKSMAQDELIPALQDGSVQLVSKATDADVITAGLAVSGDGTEFASSSYARSGLSFISFNAEEGPVSSLAVRQAIAHLVDKDALTAGVVGEYGLRAEGYFGIGQWMYQLLSGTIPYPVDEDAADAEAQLASWEALQLADIPGYTLDAEAAAALLEADGWTLNSAGEAFVAGRDDIRYKQTAEGLQPLKLTLAYAANSAAGPSLEALLPGALAQAGIGLTVEALPLAELLPQYYHVAECRYDMFFLASNFELVYDPSAHFTAENGKHVWVTSGLADEALWRASVAMRKTVPGDVYAYCRSWLDFQKAFAESLPVLPIYSNLYYDFYPQSLRNYQITASISWPQAVIGAYLSSEPAGAGE